MRAYLRPVVPVRAGIVPICISLGKLIAEADVRQTGAIATVDWAECVVTPANPSGFRLNPDGRQRRKGGILGRPQPRLANYLASLSLSVLAG